jgi:hypothetical protein
MPLKLHPLRFVALRDVEATTRLFSRRGVQKLLACASWVGRSKLGPNPLEIMPKYLCLQRNLAGADASAEKPSPAQMQAMYETLNEWREKFQRLTTLRRPEHKSTRRAALGGTSTGSQTGR